MLDKTSYKIMRILYRRPFLAEMKLREQFTPTEKAADFLAAFDELGVSGHIERGQSDDSSAAYRLTPKGKGEYEHYRRSTLELRLTQIVAVIGALTGIAGVIIGAIALRQ